MAGHPIFIHSLFRTGSTYIWNKFRQNDKYYCYYEPFHQALGELTAANIDTLMTRDFESVNHPPLARYYLYEYKPLLQDGHPGLPYFKKSFSFDEFCYKEGANPDLKKYIDYLIAGAGEKIPVFQFNRSSLRIQWFKKYYPESLNIYLLRSPGDQWLSYFEVMRKAKEKIFFVMDIVTASVNAGAGDFQQLSTHIPLIEFNHECFAEELKIYRLIEPYYSLQEKYTIFYYTWLKSLIENVLNADVVLNINRLSQDMPYRKKFENLIFKYSGTMIDYQDAKIREYDHSPISRDIMAAVETNVQPVIFCSLPKSQKKQLIKKLKTEGDKYLPIQPLDIDGVKEISNFSLADPGNSEKLKHMVSLFANKYLHVEIESRESRAENEANKKMIAHLESQLTQIQSKFRQTNQKKQEVELQLEEHKRALERIRLSLSWRLTSPLRWIHNQLKPIHQGKSNDAKSKMKIAIDVTPVLPGGDNGGIKLLLWELLKRFDHSPGNKEFILLTAAKNHELFDEFNMKRICVLKAPLPGQNQLKKRITRRIKKRFGFLGSKGLLKRNGITVLFCPFASPTYSEIGIPTVAVVADLQHLYYPFFFSKQELKHRNHFYGRLRTKADYVIAISEYTEKTIIEKLNFSPEKVYTIPISIHSRLPAPPPASIQTVLEKYALYNKKYCIYPANLWPHKNHKMLITAFAMFQKKYPADDLHLVLTGAAIGNNAILTDSITQMGIGNRVHFTGFLPEEELAVIWSQAYFLIYPSLFEGFGIPLVEAMRYKKPILASNAASIPEAAGDAAIYFDPKKPDQIVNAIQKIMEDTHLYDSLVEKGQEQLKKYDPDKMVDCYLQLLHKSSPLHV
ncbi:MAG: glycosyltransferase [Candidatus Aminicenantes bacterium]|jgi:glycosyltransferase involved in cell wall biosynthesis